MTILALDYGEKRIGAAVGNPELKTSTPVQPLKNCGREEVIRQLKRMVEEYEISRIVIGYPLNMDGSESPITRKVQKFRNRVAHETGLPTELLDERLTSFEAREILKETTADIRKNRGIIDSVSAHIILQEYLEKI